MQDGTVEDEETSLELGDLLDFLCLGGAGLEASLTFSPVCLFV